MVWWHNDATMIAKLQVKTRAAIAMHSVGSKKQIAEQRNLLFHKSYQKMSTHVLILIWLSLKSIN